MMTKRHERAGFWQTLGRVALAGWPATLQLAFLIVVLAAAAAAPRMLR